MGLVNQNEPPFNFLGFPALKSDKVEGGGWLKNRPMKNDKPLKKIIPHFYDVAWIIFDTFWHNFGIVIKNVNCKMVKFELLPLNKSTLFSVATLYRLYKSVLKISSKFFMNLIFQIIYKRLRPYSYTPFISNTFLQTIASYEVFFVSPEPMYDFNCRIMLKGGSKKYANFPNFFIWGTFLRTQQLLCLHEISRTIRVLWAVYYTSPQSFITTFLIRWPKKFGDFYWLVGSLS